MKGGVQHQRKLAAIMFTDMVGYSAAAQKNEALALQLLQEHRELLRPLFPRHGGREIETTGDAFFVEFASAVEAVNCAVEIQQTLFERNRSVTDEKRIRLRIGLHLGDVVVTEGHIHGDGVNIAARIEPLAVPGGICVSEDIERQVRNKVDLPIQKLGKGELKNIALPVDIYRVVLPWDAAPHSFVHRIIFRLRQRRVRPYAIAAILLIAAGYGAFRAYQVLTYSVQISSIAVMPLDDATMAPDMEFLGEGITNDIIERLSDLPFLKVLSIPRRHAQHPDRQTIAAMWKADGLLMGSISFQGEKVSLHFDLQSAADDRTVWSNSYVGRQSEIPDVLDELTRSLAEELDLPLMDADVQRLSRHRTRNSDAYLLYLRGMYHKKKSNRDDNALSIVYFLQAVEKDPTYLPALVALADAQEFHYERGWDQNVQLLVDAETNCRKVLALDSTNAQVMAVLGAIEVKRQSIPRGLEYFERSLVFDPDNKLALTRIAALYLVALNDPAKAITYLKRLQEIDPTDVDVVSNLGVGYAQMKNYPEAIKAFRRAVELEPDEADFRINLGYLYARIANHDSARQSYMIALKNNPRSSLVYENLVTLLLARGEFSSAESVLVLGTKMLQSDEDLLYMLGLTYSLWGKNERAHQMFQEGLSLAAQKIQRNPTLAENHAVQALFRARLGNTPGAHAATEKALKLGKNDYQVLIRIARVQAVLGETGLMLETFRRAKAMNPEYDAAYVSIAMDFEKYRDDARLLSIAREE